MEFRTSLQPVNQSPSIQLGDRFVTLGSCFANSMDQKLRENKFQSLNNPLGILYDPSSIVRVLTYAIEGSRPDDDSYYSINDMVVNLETHSDMRGRTLDEVSEAIDIRLSKLSSELKKANWLILTLGTSWVYTQISSGLQVANCHKIPQKEFEKSLLSHIVTEPQYDQLLKKLKDFNPDLTIIITVSPVRHVKDTLPLNSLSKSHLLILAHYLNNNHENVFYYPSYELILDDLRDYRFYKTDLLHPTDQAVDYVWEHFIQSYFSKEALGFLNEWESIRKALLHKAFNPSSPKHQQFVKTTIEKLKKLPSKIDVTEEIDTLTMQLVG